MSGVPAGPVPALAVGPVPYPFAAVVGQADLREALRICVVAPDVGGVLVRGERGNAKSTAVRGLAALLAPAPLIEVPLGATLDALVGSLDVGAALAGRHTVARGLLGRADGGLLYVDEVNLLADHLVDAMLDAAASGVVRVERDGVSAVESARFTLVGTMNVEEGELRPQLLDRFGLGVEVRTPADPAERAEIVRRRLRFEADPARFLAEWAPEEREVAVRIADARARYPRVRLPERELLRITHACAALGVDGVRGDLVTARAARALAALDGRDEVSEADVRRAAELALAHRRRRDPLDPGPGGPDELQRALDGPDGADGGPGGPGSEARAAGPSGGADPGGDAEPGGGADPSGGADGGGGAESGGGAEPAPDRLAAPVPARLPAGAIALDRRGLGSGTATIDTRPARPGETDPALLASVLRGELRGHVRAGRGGVLVCLVVDASGSMGARGRAARVKGALTELLREVYARRDRIALITFRDRAATVAIAPGAPIERAAAAIAALPTGGRTPLAAGLEAADALLLAERRRDPDRRSVVLVLTDGRAPDPDGRIHAAAAALGRRADAVRIVDTESGAVRLGLAGRLAAAAGGECLRLAA